MQHVSMPEIVVCYIVEGSHRSVAVQVMRAFSFWLKVRSNGDGTFLDICSARQLDDLVDAAPLSIEIEALTLADTVELSILPNEAGVSCA